MPDIDDERKAVVTRELQILGEAIRGNWATLDGRTVRDVLNAIADFLNGSGGFDCAEGRIFYHWNITVDCGYDRCDGDWECPICALEVSGDA